MARSAALAALFQQPASTAQRHYEICRAYFLEQHTAEEVAERFHLRVESIRSLVRDFAQHPNLDQLFGRAPPSDRPSPKRDAIRDRACELRRQGQTLEAIRSQLQAEGHRVSESYLFRLLHDAGVAPKGQRCRAQPQPGEHARDGSLVPAVADVQQRALTTDRQFTTQVAGLFLFVPQLLALDLPDAVRQAGLPGSEAIPPLHAFLALLLPKLLGHRRISHISDLCADEGAGLWAGLNVLPKTTYATDYSYRTDRTMHERLIAALIAKTPLGKARTPSTSTFTPSRFAGTSRTWKSTGCRCTSCSARGDGLRGPGRRAADHVLRHGQRAARMRTAWSRSSPATGKSRPDSIRARLLFDSRATTYAGLNRLNEDHVGFITIRRRGSSMLARVKRLPAASWQQCQITQAKGKRRQVRYVDESVNLDDYQGVVRQLIVTGLGHESPTFFLTNDRPERQTARDVIQTYASRNHVENRLGEQITFFHLDCLCSDVRLNVDFDLTLTVVADLLYRCLAERLKGFGQASPHTVFRKFVDTPGSVKITADEIVVRLSKRAQNPLLQEACLIQRTKAVPWLADRCVRLECP